MRRPWIKIEVSTPDKPEICAIATKLRIDPDAVVGKLVRLWSWAELSGVDPNALNVTKEFLDKVCGRKGFADALIHSGWLLESEGQLSFPHFERHNGNASKVRGLTARRVEQHRARKTKNNAFSDTKTNKKKLAKPPKEEISPAVINHSENVIDDSNLLVANEDKQILPIGTIDQTVTTESLNHHQTPEVSETTAESIPMEFEVIEEKPKKRRGKAADLDQDQPMLF